MLPYESIQQAEAALGRELTFMETLWFNYSSNKPDYIIHVHIIVSVCFFYTILPLPSVFIELFWSNKVNKYKLQRDRFNSLSDMFKCYKNSIEIFVLVVCPVQILSCPLFEWAGIRTTLALPSIWEVVCQITVYFLIHDYLVYWIHRLLHSRWFYEKIHRFHHEYTSPMGFASASSHWADILISGLPSLVFPLLVPCHITTFWSCLLLGLSAGIESHTGYSFPWNFTKYIPFYGGAEHHDYHHFVGGNSNSNFAPVFTYCDYIYGTDKGYKYYKSIAKKRELGEPMMGNMLDKRCSKLSISIVLVIAMSVR